MHRLRLFQVCLLCLVTGACSFLSDLPPPDAGPQPEQAQLTSGITSGINDSHFAKPIEITDLLRSPSSYEEPWMICVRSASSDEARRITYSVFYGTNLSNGLTGQFVKSRYSVFADNCDAQTYHPYTAPVAASALPPPNPTPEPKKHHRHDQ
jgi:hypothetical protein